MNDKFQTPMHAPPVSTTTANLAADPAGNSPAPNPAANTAVNPPDPQELLRQLHEQLQQARRHNEMIVQMARGGVIDLEAAILLADKQMSDESRQDNLEIVLQRLRSERPWLFGSPSAPVSPLQEPTAGVGPGRNDSSHVELDKAASQARQSGRRRDLIAYLRLRRTRSGR